MLIQINGQLAFCYACPKSRFRIKRVNINYYKYFGALLGILIGVFLLPSVAYLADITPENIINLTNEERAKAGLNTLTANQLLTQAAYEKGQAIIESSSFKHNVNNKKFSDWIKDTGYRYSFVGENLAIDFMTSEGILDAWLNSESHKKNLLSTFYKEIGVAIIEDKFNGQNTTLVVQVFGAPPTYIAQPKVMGTDNYSRPIAQNNFSLPASYLDQVYNPENMLTHSVINSLTSNLTLTNANKLLPIANDYNGYTSFSLNKYFAQYNLYYIFNMITYALITALLAFIVYIYYFSFSRLPGSE